MDPINPILPHKHFAHGGADLARQRRYAYLLWFLAPFTTLLIAIWNYRAPSSKNMLWLFAIFYGYTFVISNNQLDSNRYAENLVILANQHGITIGDFVNLLYGEETDYVDILQPLVTFLVSRFTSDARILFAFFGLIFGFFYSRNIWFLLSFAGQRIKTESLPFLLLFVFMISLWQINGFRFATASQVFIYGLFALANQEKRKGTLICIASLFVHFSFVLPVLVLLIHLLIGRRLFICFALYFVSFFMSQATPDFFTGYAKSLPEVFQERTSGYTSEAYLEARAKLAQKAVNWYITWRTLAIMYLSNLVLIVIFIKYRKLLADHKVAAGLICFALLLSAIANVLSGIPSAGLRFQLVAYAIMFASLYLFIQRAQWKLLPGWVTVPAMAAMLLYVIVEIRIGFDTMGIMTVIGNPFIAPFVDSDIPLIDLIK